MAATLNCAGGYVSGALTIATNGVLNITGGLTLSYPCVLTNLGTVTWSGSGSVSCSSGVVYNEPGAVFDVQNDQLMSGGGFQNAGLVRKSAGTGTTTINSSFNNTGAVQIQTGTVNFSGLLTENPGSSLSGTWRGNLTLSGTWTNDLTIATDAYLVGTNTMAATLNCAGGRVSGALTIATNGVLNITGGLTLSYPCVLTNLGTVTWSGSGSVSCSGGVVYNEPGAVFDVQNDQQMTGGGFQNAGLFRKSAGTGTTTINSSFNNTGVLDAQSGIIRVDGTYTQTGCTLNVRLNSQTDFGRITFSGALSLVGAFNADLNTSFVPTNNSTFQVLTFGSASGAFSSITAAAPPIWRTNFTATSFALTTVSTISWPALADIVYGTPLGTNQLNASAGVPGTYSYDPPAGTVLLSGNGQVLTVSFTPSDPTELTATIQVPINVLKAPLTITANDQSKTYGTAFTFAGREFTTADWSMATR